jgi:formylglycine-generating enzyme required for sulfatase activity
MQAQAAGGKPAVREIDLGNGVKMRLRLIPAGEFVMGESASNIPLPGDERHRMVVKVDKPFWMAECEVSNAQFARFDPQHDSRLESRHGYQFGRLGWPLNEPNQPAVRLSAKEAQAFCDWLSSKVGAKVSLPSEAQWEWAARAGSDQPFWFGDLSGDFSRFANLGDRRLKEYAADTSYEHYAAAGPLKDPNRYDDWVPKDDRFDDGSFLSAAVGKYEANPWGLRDMHGNVWEWTRTQYQAQPNAAVVTQTGPVVGDGKVSVRGGSFYDRPIRCRSASRLFYPSWQRVFNVGFRVVVEP